MEPGLTTIKIGRVTTMRTTIDKAGRLVVPKSLRDRLGLGPGVVEVTAEGASLRVSPVADDELVVRSGRPIISGRGARIDDEFVRNLRDSDQK